MAPAALRVERVYLSDFDAAQVFFAAAFNPGWQLQRWSGHSCVTIRRQLAAGLVIDEFVVEGPLRCRLTIAGSVTVIQPRLGSLVVAGDALAGPRPALLTAGAAPAVLAAESATFQVVTIDVNLLHKVAAEDNPKQLQHLQFASADPLPPKVVAAWHHTLDYVLADLNGIQSGLRPLTVPACARMLAAATLECFPPGTAEGQDRRGVPPASRAFADAVSFMHLHAGEDIGISDIAAAVCLTPRSVQYLFRQQADMTPMEYLRGVRLQSARAELLRGNQSGTSVSAVAQKWGFAHSGRFSAYYRQAYGEKPFATLAASVCDEAGWDCSALSDEVAALDQRR